MAKDKSPDFIAQCAYGAAVMEASAEKPGNVTPTKGFEDLGYEDFIEAAERLKPFIAEAARKGEDAELGKLIYDATSEGKNVNFGIIIMFMPLAAVKGGSAERLLASLTKEDTKWMVRAMQKGRLGSMGLEDKKLARYDVMSKGIFKTIESEGITPLGLMQMSRPYDTLAKEWTDGYPISRGISARIGTDPKSITKNFIQVLSEHPDTLIARKRGLEEAKKVSRMARKVLSGKTSISEFDNYLRSDGNALNPGTTADLIATGLFLKLMG